MTSSTQQDNTPEEKPESVGSSCCGGMAGKMTDCWPMMEQMMAAFMSAGTPGGGEPREENTRAKSTMPSFCAEMAAKMAGCGCRGGEQK